jgi:hypothetical protein
MASNKRRRHTPDQIIRKLAEGHKLLAGATELDEVCRHLEIAESTWHRWLAQCGGMKANGAKLFLDVHPQNVVASVDGPHGDLGKADQQGAHAHRVAFDKGFSDRVDVEHRHDREAPVPCRGSPTPPTPRSDPKSRYSHTPSTCPCR